MATAQVNVRIDTDMKAAGDAALAQIGYSPTRAVRALWGFASRNRGNRKVLRDTFAALEGKNAERESETLAAERVQRAIAGPRIFEQALEQLGASAPAPEAETPYEALLEQAYLEKMRERGTLA